MSVGHIVKAATPKGFWTEPVTYVTDGYKPGQIAALLRSRKMVRKRARKGGG